jgi:hypothetical protein
MRSISMLHPNDGIPVPPDTVCTLLIAGSSGQAMDWPSGSNIIRATGVTTVGAALNFMVNLFSTQCAAPASGSSAATAASSGVNHPVNGSGMFQVPGASTGFSVAALSSGYIMIECWKR